MINIKEYLYEIGIFNNNDIRMFWYRGMDNKNFGDILGPYLAEKISNKRIQYSHKNCLREYYLTIGSIISAANKNAIIWGSGIISNTCPIHRPKEVLSVRGPKTRERLMNYDIKCPKIYGDPALLIQDYYSPKIKETFKLGIIPHYVDYDYINYKYKNEDVKIINILDPLEKVIDDINSCEYTISSSLHGIIVSQAYGISSMQVMFSNKLAGDGIKFIDYYESVQIKPYKPYKYHNKIQNINEIIERINMKHSKKISIDLERLLSVCPFY